MPWPMVHFAISEGLFNQAPTSNLLLGSIAPDSIHVRGQITREEKGVTHFVHNGQLPTKELILEKYHEYWLKRQDPEWKDFVLGYFSHIYTDLRWTETVYADFEKEYTGNEIREIYNQEVSQIEFELLRSMRNADKLLMLIQKADGFTISPLVTQLEVIQYRDMKVNWLRDQDHEPRITPMYFKPDKIENFIHVTVKELKEQFNEMNLHGFTRQE